MAANIDTIIGIFAGSIQGAYPHDSPVRAQIMHQLFQVRGRRLAPMEFLINLRNLLNDEHPALYTRFQERVLPRLLPIVPTASRLQFLHRVQAQNSGIYVTVQYLLLSYVAGVVSLRRMNMQMIPLFGNMADLREVYFGVVPFSREMHEQEEELNQLQVDEEEFLDFVVDADDIAFEEAIAQAEAEAAEAEAAAAELAAAAEVAAAEVAAAEAAAAEAAEAPAAEAAAAAAGGGAPAAAGGDQAGQAAPDAPQIAPDVQENAPDVNNPPQIPPPPPVNGNGGAA